MSDREGWAQPVDRLEVAETPKGATALNVDGRRPVGALQGFGQMWQKTYQVRLAGSSATPEQVIKTWRDNFSDFWPERARMYAPVTGLEAGELGLISMSGPARMTLSTGVRVIYADDTSFTFMTPEGHPFAGWITFSAVSEGDVTVVQALVLISANDPLYEIVFRVFGSREEDRFWTATLENLSAQFGVRGQVTQDTVLVDPRLQWSHAKNIWNNAAIRTLLYAPIGLVKRVIGRGPQGGLKDE